MKYIILLALIGMIILCMGLQYAPKTEPTETPKPTPEVIPPVRELKPVVLPTPEPQPPEITVDTYSAELIAKTLYGEYRGTDKLQQAAVVWCILNRCDAWGMTVEAVITAPNQFHGYSPNNPVEPYLYDMAVDVLTRHEREKLGEIDVGRVLPSDYLWFGGNGYTNTFRNAYSGGNRWDWSYPDPYKEEVIINEVFKKWGTQR